MIADEATSYKIIDRRTGCRVSMNTYGPLWYAHATIVAWRQRDRRGGRPDLQGLAQHLAIAVEDGQ